MACVAPSDWSRYPKGRIQPGELLVEVKGKAEKLAIVPNDFPGNTLVTGTCFKLSTKDPDDRYWLLAYLTCRYGQVLKNRLKTNLLVSYLAKEDLYSLPVPQLSRRLAAEIKRAFLLCFDLNLLGRAGTQKAEALLAKRLSLESWQAPEPLSYTRSSLDAFKAKRLDAEHFSEKFYAARNALLKAGATELIPLSDLLTALTNGQTPLRHDLQVGEVPFLCAEHVSDFGINYESEKRVLKTHHLNELARTALRDGDVLMTIKGRVGNAALVENVPGHVNINQDVALLRFNNELPIWYVIAFLNSRFGKLQTEQMCTGAINPFLGLFSIRKFTVPRFDQRVMRAIADETRNGVVAARVAQQRANELLEAAKRAVEIAIEQSEAAALAYLAKVNP